MNAKRNVDFITVTSGIAEERSADPESIVKELKDILKDNNIELPAGYKKTIYTASILINKMYTESELSDVLKNGLSAYLEASERYIKRLQVGGIKTEGRKTKTSPAAVKRYKEKNIRQVKMDLNIKTDADILEKLDSLPNKTGYIKELIRADLNKTK